MEFQSFLRRITFRSQDSFLLAKTMIETSVMAKIGIPHFWKSLRWTIMVKFLAASVLTWFIGTQMGLMFEYNDLCTNSPPEKIAVEIESNLPEFSASLEAENFVALNLQMREISEKLKIRQRRLAHYFFYNLEQKSFPNRNFAEVVVIGKNGEPIDGLTAQYQGFNKFAKTFNETEQLLINKALQGETGSQRIEAERENLLTFPLKSNSGAVSGVLFVSEKVPFSWFDATTKATRDFLNDLSEFWITLAICAFLFGFLQAHRITKRFEKIAVAAQSWSKGDFSARAPENPVDELGGLSQMLNQMATSLREVFKIKQELAMSEERNRIARDLHDSVKQQIFGLGMQIGAAKATLKNNPEAVENRLHEAENLVRQVQAELVDLIRELRPQDGENFRERLENYVKVWTRQNGIRAEILLEKDFDLSQTVEFTLFRIIQEALANVAKHSRANKVGLELKSENADFCVSISDNGIGFKPEDSSKGIGLKTMRERAETLKSGSLKIESEKGVKITVEFEN